MIRSTLEDEFEEINARNGWPSVFQEIKEKCDREARDNSFTLSASSENHNRLLNRYRDVNPYDHSRIILHRGKVDYINANLVESKRAGRKYILTQGPLKETIGHFWLMIWEQNTKAIVMLNKLLEKKQIKCHMYWPNEIGSEHSLHMKDVGLTVEYIKCEEYANFLKRTFRLTDVESNTEREVLQFHYTTWPDFGVPSSPIAFLHFLNRVRESGALEEDVGPAVIHCSAGIGRSGTFCLADCCLVIIGKENENDISVREILHELRSYRMGLIQTADQLFFSYQAIIEGIKMLEEPNLNIYEEVPLRNYDSNEEIPPPIPPRNQSLPIVDKPLPTIPNSESVDEELSTTENISPYDNYSSDSLILPIREEPPKSAASKEGNPAKNMNNPDENSIETYNVTRERSENNNQKSEKEMSSIDNDANAASDGKSEEPNIKRRKRIEKQATLQNKIDDIKHKQREIDERIKTSKKRKSFYKCILAGVVVGSICVYAYSKYNSITMTK